MGHNVFMIKGIKTYISKTELIRYSKHFKFDDICSHINETQFTPSYRDFLNYNFFQIYFGHKHVVTGPHSLHELATSLKYNMLLILFSEKMN